jgi:hypothetical protein
LSPALVETKPSLMHQTNYFSSSITHNFNNLET